MPKLLIPLLITLSALLGLLDATYLTYEKWYGSPPPCNLHFQCQTVLDSSWSSLFGIPLSVWGGLYYASILGLGIFMYWVAGQNSSPQRTKTLKRGLLLLTMGGSLFSLYLLFIMGVVLKAWCLYCLFSAFNCQLLLLLSVINFYKKT